MNPEFEESYARYLAGEMSDEERSAFEKSVIDDPELSEEMYADLNVASRIESGKVVRGPVRWWVWAAPLAAAALILLAVNLTNPTIEATSPVMRGAESTIDLLAPRGEVGEIPSRFEWVPVAGAILYRFELMDADARVRQRTVVAETFVIVEDAPESGAWRVVALDELGEELMSSPPTRFELAH